MSRACFKNEQEWNVTNPSLGGALTTFPTQNAAMTIMADWWEAGLKAAMGSNYSNVGVAPIPVGPSGTKPITVSYSWLWTVTGQAQKRGDATMAWRFINWLDTPNTSTSLSPMGKWLEGLGILPSRTSDYTNNASLTSDPFLAPYINAMSSGSAPAMPAIGPYEQVIDTLWHTIRGIEGGTVEPASGMQLAASESNSFISSWVG